MNKYYMSSIVLMITSFIMLFLGFSYYKLEGNVSKIVYSDKNEYNDINKGLNYINTLPMNINIINEYFYDLNNLSNSNKEQILFSYIFKNNYKLYDCGSSSFKSNLCINKTDINNTLLLDKIPKVQKVTLNIYLIIIIALNVLIVFLQVQYYFEDFIVNYLHKNMELSGRV